MEIESAVEKIRLFFKNNKRLPSYREMCTLFGFASKHASFKLAQKLIEAGVLEKDQTGKLIPRKLFLPLPLLGIIRAGHPTLAEEQLLNTLSFDDFLVGKPEKSYILKVSGDSMIDEGIHEGDLVIVEKDSKAKEGDVIVAFIDNEFTLKYFRMINNKVCLVAANKKYPVIYPKDSLSIFGIVVSVIRKYH